MNAYRKYTRGRALAPIALVILGLLLLAGCRRLELDVTVDRNGGGERRLLMTVEPRQGGDGAPTEEQARELLGVTTARGWREGVTERTGDDGKPQKLTTYARLARVAGLGDWPAADGDIRVLAAPAGSRHADVQLANRVEVEIGRGGGATTWSYRETFAWNGLQEVLADAVADRYREAMASAFPSLGTPDLAEIRGIARGALVVGLRAGGAGERGTDLDEDMLIGALADAAADVVARTRPGVAAGRLHEIATAVVKDEGNALGDVLDRDLPGVGLAGETTVVLTLRLPGRVVETNGETAADGSVRWEFSAGDPLGRPQECWAKSELAP